MQCSGKLEKAYVVVVQSFGDASIMRVVLIVVVAAVLRVCPIKGLHTQRSFQDLVRDLESRYCVLRIEKMRRHRHGDRVVAPELVVRPLAVLWRPIDVLVDTTAINDTRIDGILLVVGRIFTSEVGSAGRILESERSAHV